MFATYDELKAHVADWLHRGDLTEQIPTFIRMGEGWLNRKLRIRPMLVTEQKTVYANTSWLAAPSNAAWIQDIFLLENGAVYGDKLRPGSALNPALDNKGKPEYWEPGLSGAIFDCYADQNYTVDLEFGQKFNLAADSINWLLNNAPEAYLYSSLMHASQYALDEPRLAAAAGQAQAIVAELNKAYAISNTDLVVTYAD